MKILILEDKPRSAKRLIRMLKDIDPMFVPEGPLGSIKETEAFFRSGEIVGPHSCRHPPERRFEFRSPETRPFLRAHPVHHRLR